jgi:hypothetical protein
MCDLSAPIPLVEQSANLPAAVTLVARVGLDGEGMLMTCN